MGWMVGLVMVIVVVAVIARAVGLRKKSRPRRTSRSGTGGRSKSSASGSAATIDSPRSSPKFIGASLGRRSGKAFDMRWFGKDDELKVGGFTLKGPCVYASSRDETGHLRATDPSEILLHAPVERARGAAAELRHWPWYARIEPAQRFAYLSWLASGRAALPPSEGYLFLYFYGIERRLLLDEADRAWGLQEIVRLRRLEDSRTGAPEGRSFRSYSTALLWYEIARTPNLFDDKAFHLAVQLTDRWTPELMTAPLAWLAARERPLPASIAREIAAGDPTAQRSVVTKRVPEEFGELFETRYRDAFGGEGMALRISKRDAWHTYRPASGGLEEMRMQVPNPMGIRSQFKKLPDIWNSCIADLRKLSRVSASTGTDALTVDAWEAMPEELRSDIDHPLSGSVAAILARHSGKSAEEDEAAYTSGTMVEAGRFAELFGIEQRATLTAAQSRRLATVLEHTGYGIVPDARLTPIRYGWNDLVAVVPGLDSDAVESARYNAAVCVLRLGLSIALADGEADEVEIRMLSDHIDAVFDLSPQEQLRLAALRDLLLTTGSDIRPIATKIKEMLPADARRKVGRLLVVIAASSNGIDRSERAALRKAFRALDLAAELLEEAIAEVAPEADEAEVAVRPAEPGTRSGEPIPAASAGGGFRLNHEAISAIMAETRAVSVMLAEAMGAVDAEVARASESTAEPLLGTTRPPNARPEIVMTSVAVLEAGAAAITGPGGRYEPLFAALIGRDRWNRDEADAIARSEGLMLDAGVETINDWAFEALGAPLIEDEGDELFVDRSLLNESA